MFCYKLNDFHPKQKDCDKWLLIIHRKAQEAEEIANIFLLKIYHIVCHLHFRISCKLEFNRRKL